MGGEGADRMTAKLFPKDEAPDLYVGEIVEIVKDHPWGGCLVVVSEVRSWGCIADLRMPDGFAPIRLHAAEIIRLGARVQQVLTPPIYKPQEQSR